MRSNHDDLEPGCEEVRRPGGDGDHDAALADALLEAILQGTSIFDLAERLGCPAVEVVRRLGGAAKSGRLSEFSHTVDQVLDAQVACLKLKALARLQGLINDPPGETGGVNVDRARAIDLSRRVAISMLRLNLHGSNRDDAERGLKCRDGEGRTRGPRPYGMNEGTKPTERSSVAAEETPSSPSADATDRAGESEGDREHPGSIESDFEGREADPASSERETSADETMSGPCVQRGASSIDAFDAIDAIDIGDPQRLSIASASRSLGRPP